jgi:RNA polymerase sigma-70 factor (ECF subfamily)
VGRWAAPEASAIDRETQGLIEQAIGRLPECYRDVYVLADVEELPACEVAGLLGLSVAAVKSRLRRARLRMRRALAPHFEERAGVAPGAKSGDPFGRLEASK